MKGVMLTMGLVNRNILKGNKQMFRPIDERTVRDFRNYIRNTPVSDLPKPTDRVTHAFDSMPDQISRVMGFDGVPAALRRKLTASVRRSKAFRLGVMAGAADALESYPLDMDDPENPDGCDADDPAERLRAVLEAEGVDESVIVAAINALNVGEDDDDEEDDEGEVVSRMSTEDLDEQDYLSNGAGDEPVPFKGMPRPGGGMDEQDEPEQARYARTEYDGRARDEAIYRLARAKIDNTSIPASPHQHGREVAADPVFGKRASYKFPATPVNKAVLAVDQALSISPSPSWVEPPARRGGQIRKGEMAIDAMPDREAARKVRHALDKHLAREDRESAVGFMRRFPTIPIPKQA